MAADKYQGFETMQFIGIFLCDGEGGPIVLGLDMSAATDALIRRTASDEEVTQEEARVIIERRLTNGDYFHAPVALRGAFQNDGDHEGSKPEAYWIDEAVR